MARLALFSLGFLVYTAVAAISMSQHPAQYISENKAHGSLAGACSSPAHSTGLTQLNGNSSL
jgi:hypothetical protein